MSMAPQSLTSDAFRAGLERLLRALFGDSARLETLARLSGGASQETWLLEALIATHREKLILRRAPTGAAPVTEKISLPTEAALMEALRAAGAPSPQVLHVLSPQDQLGEGFLMRFVDGEALGARIVRDERFAQARANLLPQIGRALAAIHALDPARLPALPHRSACDELARMIENYRRDSAPRPVFELAIAWLKKHMPEEPAPPRVVHGDFRTGNYMADAQGLTAVLDWELAHLGDPARDLGWFCVNSWRFGAIDKPAGGIGAREDLLAAYTQAGGAPVTLEQLKFWETFGVLRWGVMCIGMGARAKQTDRPVELSMIGRRASETEIDLLRLLAPRGA
jgi:aminoglycoside phosphotransferase (APT) family kinase protein